MRALLAVVVAISLQASSSALAGYYTEHETVLPNPMDLTKSTKAVVRTWHEGRRYKRENPARQETVIIDLNKGEVYGINTEKKTFWKLPAEKYRSLAMFSLIVLGVQPQADGSVTVVDPLLVPTGQKATIDRWAAEELRVAPTLPNGVQTSIWVSKDAHLPVSELVDQLRVSLGDPRGAGYEDLFRQWAALPAYPVQTVTTVRTANGVVVSSETLLSFREMKIPAAEFTVPKGYVLVGDPLTDLERRVTNATAAPAAPPAVGATPAR